MERLLLGQGGVVRPLLVVSLSITHERTRLCTSTKHGRHEQRVTVWNWLNFGVGSTITSALALTLHRCGFVQCILTRQMAPPCMQLHFPRQCSSLGGVWAQLIWYCSVLCHVLRLCSAYAHTHKQFLHVTVDLCLDLIIRASLYRDGHHCIVIIICLCVHLSAI